MGWWSSGLVGCSPEPPFGGYATTFPPQAGALQGSAKPCTHKSLYFKHGLFCHRLRGKSGAAGKGGRAQRANPQNAYHTLWHRKVNPVTTLASPLGEEGHEVANGCTRGRMIMILDVDVTAERRHYNTHRPLKGKRLTTFCASLALLHPLLSLTHWIFRSLMLPYKSSSHSAKCVRCAPLRSGAADWRSGK